MQKLRAVPRIVFIVMLACYLSGCTSWRVQAMTPHNVISQRQPEGVWVMPRGRSVGLLIQRPFIRNDSLLGWVKNAGTIGVPLSDVTSISLREPDGGKTAGLVVGIVAVLALGVFLGIQAILNDPSY